MLTVISPAAHQRLTTVATIESELDLTGGADDAYLATLIDQASEAIVAWCGRPFAVEGVRETLHRDGRAGGNLMLSRFPVVGVDAVTIGGTVIKLSLSCPSKLVAKLSGPARRRSSPISRSLPSMRYRKTQLLESPARTFR